jgi:hypothetical protein
MGFSNANIPPFHRRFRDAFRRLKSVSKKTWLEGSMIPAATMLDTRPTGINETNERYWHRTDVNQAQEDVRIQG